MQVVPNAVAVRATIKPGVLGESTHEVVIEVAPLGYSPVVDDYAAIGEWVKPVTVKLSHGFASFDHVTKKREVVPVTSGVVTLAVKTKRGSTASKVAESNQVPYLEELFNMLLIRGTFVNSKNWLLPQLDGALIDYPDSQPLPDHRIVELALS